MQIIDARPEHVPGITRIYNDAVRTTTAIWNETEVDAAERLSWYRGRLEAGFPVLVAVDEGGDVLGYSTYGPFRPHEGYRRSVEHSVYVERDARGGGIGRALLEAVIDWARAADVHVMIGGIAAENTGSIRLHERLGFQHVGQLPQVGMKFGRWLDLAFLQLVLDSAPTPTD